MTKQLNFVKEYVSPYILTLLRQSESERIDRWRKTYDLPVRRNKAKAKAKKNKPRKAQRIASQKKPRTTTHVKRCICVVRSKPTLFPKTTKINQNKINISEHFLRTSLLQKTHSLSTLSSLFYFSHFLLFLFTKHTLSTSRKALC